MVWMHFDGQHVTLDVLVSIVRQSRQELQRCRRADGPEMLIENAGEMRLDHAANNVCTGAKACPCHGASRVNLHQDHALIIYFHPALRKGSALSASVVLQLALC